MARITDSLCDDHARLHALLATALGEPCDQPPDQLFDQAAFDGSRRGLLRHAL